MENQRVHGGEIDQCLKINQKSKGKSKVKIIYKDDAGSLSSQRMEYSRLSLIPYACLWHCYFLTCQARSPAVSPVGRKNGWYLVSDNSLFDDFTCKHTDLRRESFSQTLQYSID